MSSAGELTPCAVWAALAEASAGRDGDRSEAGPPAGEEALTDFERDRGSDGEGVAMDSDDDGGGGGGVGMMDGEGNGGLMDGI